MKVDEEHVGKVKDESELNKYLQSNKFTKDEFDERRLYMTNAIKSVGEANEDYYLYQGNNRALEKKIQNANSIEDHKKILKILLEWRAFPHANLNQQLANRILNARESSATRSKFPDSWKERNIAEIPVPWEIKGYGYNATSSEWTASSWT